MKTNNKILYTFFFIIIALTANAQILQNTRNSNWIISKEVQRFSNWNLSKDSSTTIASVETPPWVQSKEIMKGGNKKNRGIAQPGNLVSLGYPQWIISKEVQRKRR